MTSQFRRIITGVNDDGDSFITIDGPTGNDFQSEAGSLFSVWQTTHDKLNPRDTRDMALEPLTLAPPTGGSRMMVFTLPPVPSDVSSDTIETMNAQSFAEIGATDAQVNSARHPAMHKTDTIDYVILLSGNVSLVLEDEEVQLKPFDIVVQRGTNHAWVTHGDKPAIFAAVLIDVSIEPPL